MFRLLYEEIKPEIVSLQAKLEAAWRRRRLYVEENQLLPPEANGIYLPSHLITTYSPLEFSLYSYWLGELQNIFEHYCPSLEKGEEKQAQATREEKEDKELHTACDELTLFIGRFMHSISQTPLCFTKQQTAIHKLIIGLAINLSAGNKIPPIKILLPDMPQDFIAYFEATVTESRNSTAIQNALMGCVWGEQNQLIPVQLTLDNFAHNLEKKPQNPWQPGVELTLEEQNRVATYSPEAQQYYNHIKEELYQRNHGKTLFDEMARFIGQVEQTSIKKNAAGVQGTGEEEKVHEEMFQKVQDRFKSLWGKIKEDAGLLDFIKTLKPAENSRTNLSHIFEIFFQEADADFAVNGFSLRCTALLSAAGSSILGSPSHQTALREYFVEVDAQGQVLFISKERSKSAVSNSLAEEKNSEIAVKNCFLFSVESDLLRERLPNSPPPIVRDKSSRQLMLDKFIVAVDPIAYENTIGTAEEKNPLDQDNHLLSYYISNEADTSHLRLRAKPSQFSRRTINQCQIKLERYFKEHYIGYKAIYACNAMLFQMLQLVYPPGLSMPLNLLKTVKDFWFDRKEIFYIVAFSDDGQYTTDRIEETRAAFYSYLWSLTKNEFQYYLFECRKKTEALKFLLKGLGQDRFHRLLPTLSSILPFHWHFDNILNLSNNNEAIYQEFGEYYFNKKIEDVQDWTNLVNYFFNYNMRLYNGDGSQRYHYTPPDNLPDQFIAKCIVRLLKDAPTSQLFLNIFDNISRKSYRPGWSNFIPSLAKSPIFKNPEFSALLEQKGVNIDDLINALDYQQAQLFDGITDSQWLSYFTRYKPSPQKISQFTPRIRALIFSHVEYSLDSLGEEKCLNLIIALAFKKEELVTEYIKLAKIPNAALCAFLIKLLEDLKDEKDNRPLKYSVFRRLFAQLAQQAPGLLLLPNLLEQPDALASILNCFRSVDSSELPFLGWWDQVLALLLSKDSVHQAMGLRLCQNLRIEEFNQLRLLASPEQLKLIAGIINVNGYDPFLYQKLMGSKTPEDSEYKREAFLVIPDEKQQPPLKNSSWEESLKKPVLDNKLLYALFDQWLTSGNTPFPILESEASLLTFLQQQSPQVQHIFMVTLLSPENRQKHPIIIEALLARSSREPITSEDLFCQGLLARAAITAQAFDFYSPPTRSLLLKLGKYDNALHEKLAIHYQKIFLAPASAENQPALSYPLVSPVPSFLFCGPRSDENIFDIICNELTSQIEEYRKKVKARIGHRQALARNQSIEHLQQSIKTLRSLSDQRSWKEKKELLITLINEQLTATTLHHKKSGFCLLKYFTTSDLARAYRKVLAEADKLDKTNFKRIADSLHEGFIKRVARR